MSLLRSIVIVLVLGGCPQTVEPPPPDDAGMLPPDGRVLDFTDSDLDGLCDRTEISRGTDPSLDDTDGDGLSDRFEIDFGYEPLRTDSPENDSLVFLTEMAGAGTQASFQYATPRSTTGATYAGAFEAQAVPDVLDLSAADFFVAASAIGADPMQNVFEVREEEQRFVGVTGRTLLIFEARFAFASNVPRVCARGYPFRYLVKRENDGVLVSSQRRILVIVPAGERIDTADWCVPEGMCI